MQKRQSPGASQAAAETRPAPQFNTAGKPRAATLRNEKGV